MGEIKTFAFELTKLDGRTFEGYASTFGNLDLVGDIIHPGAFTKTLTERGNKIRLLWQHDPSEPIGRPVELREDGKGLFIKAILSDCQRGRDALALLKDGAIGEMSIGYDSVAGGTDYSKGVNGKTIRNLREVKLYEVSLVTFAANPEALVTAVKGAIPFKATDMAPEDMAWDGGRAVRECEGRDQLRMIHAWVDPDGDPNVKSSYKLPHHNADGTVVWAGVANAMSRLPQANIPDADVAGVRRHLEGHYRQFDKEPPAEKEMTLQGPNRVMGDVLVGYVRQTMDSLCNDWLTSGIISQEEHTTMRRAGDDCMDMLRAAMPGDMASRSLGSPMAMMGMMAVQIDQEAKRGDWLNRSSRAKLREAMATISNLLAKYEEDEEPDSDSSKNAPPNQGAALDMAGQGKAGPDPAIKDSPTSTERLLAFIDVSLAQLKSQEVA